MLWLLQSVIDLCSDGDDGLSIARRSVRTVKPGTVKREASDIAIPGEQVDRNCLVVLFAFLTQVPHGDSECVSSECIT